MVKRLKCLTSTLDTELKLDSNSITEVILLNKNEQQDRSDVKAGGLLRAL